MVSLLSDSSKAAPLFAHWEETMLYSCLQGVMGRIFVTDPEAPRAAAALLGDFGFFAGEPEEALLAAVPERFIILTPRDERWAALIEKHFPEAEKQTRYALKKGTRFNEALLRQYAAELPAGYAIKTIDGALYAQCLSDPVTRDFVSVFGSREAFLALGRGRVIVKDGVIVSGASSYTRYREGIEIEVDTRPEERRKHLALAAAAALILACSEEGLYPSWDAQNTASLRLAEKLGYTFSHPYTVYTLAQSNGIPSDA